MRKAERKNRDEFRKLMEEHVANGILTAKTHWRDYCTKVGSIIHMTRVDQEHLFYCALTSTLFRLKTHSHIWQYLRTPQGLKQKICLRMS